MKEVLFRIGWFKINGYGLMIALGIIMAIIMAEKREKKFILDGQCAYNIAIWGLIGGFIGAKLLYWITILPKIIQDPAIIIKTLSNGYVVFGGIIGGILAGFIYCRKYELNFVKYIDLLIPSVALGQGFGRIGCFLAGCCYGKETDSILGVVFTESSFAPNGVRLIPIQLIFSLADFINCLILLLIYKKREDGLASVMYLILYSTGRFVLEFFRGDPRGKIGVLSTSQFIAVFTFIIGIILLIKLKVTQKTKKEIG